MKNSKKRLIIVTTVILLLLIGGIFLANYLKSVSDYQTEVENITFSDIDISQISDGTYTGDCNVDFIYAKVEVTIKSGKIIDIEILEHKNDRGQAAEVIIDQVVEEQTLDVDAVSSATNSSKVIKKAIENALLSGVHTSWNYGDFEGFSGFSNLLIFPKSLEKSAVIRDYYYDFSNSLVTDFLDPTCQIYLECDYSEADYYKEIERLSKIQVEYHGEINKIKFDEIRFNYPAYVAIDADNYCYEYALLVEEKYRIVYIFTQFVGRDKVVFYEGYLPKDYMKIDDPIGDSIYMFDIGGGDRHGVY